MKTDVITPCAVKIAQLHTRDQLPPRGCNYARREISSFMWNDDSDPYWWQWPFTKRQIAALYKNHFTKLYNRKEEKLGLSLNVFALAREMQIDMGE
jgi:hypothetical protein